MAEIHGISIAVKRDIWARHYASDSIEDIMRATGYTRQVIKTVLREQPPRDAANRGTPRDSIREGMERGKAERQDMWEILQRQAFRRAEETHGKVEPKSTMEIEISMRFLEQYSPKPKKSK